MALAEEVTLASVARFAERYELVVFNHPDTRRDEALPAHFDDRTQYIQDTVEDLHQRYPSDVLCIYLYKGAKLDDGPVLADQHEGPPALLALTVDEAALVREAWVRSGLPSDLYYPLHLQRQREEAVVRFGTTVRETVVYSPRQWLAMEPAPSPSFPDENDRRNRFLSACAEFRRAVFARISELTEQHSTDKTGELLDLAGINLDIAILELEENGLSADHLRAARLRRFATGGG
ncbi:MAG TPA: hypothetical protein VK009_16370 [Chloroflexota bacterium]|nr:hypothetical protein [Chloroflexota bacterium]